jgi:hypothetical protein
MGIPISAAPHVLGVFSLTAAVEFICCLHLVTCVIILSLTSSSEAVAYGGVEVSPEFQCANAAWFLAGIPVIVMGGVGACYRVESHLTAYMAYLTGTLGVVIMWLIFFVNFGNTCETLQPRVQHSSSPGEWMVTQASFVCGVTNGLQIFGMAALVGVFVAAIYLVWSMKVYIKNRHETELLRYQEPWQTVQAFAEDMAQEQAMAQEAAKQRALQPGNVPGGAAMPLYAVYQPEAAYMMPGYSTVRPGAAPPSYGGMEEAAATSEAAAAAMMTAPGPMMTGPSPMTGPAPIA